MSDARVEQIYKVLRLVPDFDGNSAVLTRFINLCDEIVKQYMNNDPVHELGNLAVINGILNKITGPAARTINSNGVPGNWSGIRSALINNFADQRDEASLYNDLSLLTQGSASPQEFYEQCQNLFSIIMTYINLHETVKTTVEAKRTLYKKLTLRSYLRGLRDPLGARIRCMRPETIEDALEYVNDEVNTLYLQQRNDHLPERKLQSTSSYNNQPKFSYSLPPPVPLALPPRTFGFNPPKPFNMPGPSRPFNMPPGPSRQFNTQPPQRPMPSWKPQPPHFSGPTRTQQMFAAPPPNYRPQSNVFRLPPKNPGFTYNNTNAAPSPMSGVSHYVAKPFQTRTPHDWTKFGNPPPSNYFKTRELNFNEFYEPTEQYQPCYDYYDYNQYEQDYYEQPDFTDNYYYPCYPETQPPLDETCDANTTDNNEDFQIKAKSEKLK